MSHHSQTPGLRNPDAASLLHRFRSSVKRRIPLHPLERIVLTAVAIHLCYLPWHYGAMHLPSQITSLVMSFIGFVFALIPRTYSGDYVLPVAGRQWPAGGPQPDSPAAAHRRPPTGVRLNPWPRLLRFPLFWIGLALLAYIALQGFNPSWVWERNEKFWWLRRVDNIPWLPTSIDTPFERFNLWRQFMIYASAWLTVCTVWVGFTRRRSLMWLLSLIIANAGVIALVAGWQLVSGNRDFPSFLTDYTTARLKGSFVYHNHAGAYFALIAALTAAFACHQAFGTAGKKSTPAPLLALLALFFAVTTVFTQSRSATLTLAVFAIGALALVVIPAVIRNIADTGRRAVTVSVASLIALALGLTIQWLDFGKAITKFERAIDQQGEETSIKSRLLGQKAAWDYLKDRGMRGVGAGGFRYLFPEYVKKYPEIVSRPKGRKVIHLTWEHAHNDWLQIPIELGAMGSSIVLLGAGWIGIGLVRCRVWRSPLAFMLVIGCAQTLLHAAMDFPFQNPAILITWCVLALMAIRSAELESL